MRVSASGAAPTRSHVAFSGALPVPGSSGSSFPSGSSCGGSAATAGAPAAPASISAVATLASSVVVATFERPASSAGVGAGRDTAAFRPHPTTQNNDKTASRFNVLPSWEHVGV